MGTRRRYSGEFGVDPIRARDIQRRAESSATETPQQAFNRQGTTRPRSTYPSKSGRDPWAFRGPFLPADPVILGTKTGADARFHAANRQIAVLWCP